MFVAIFLSNIFKESAERQIKFNPGYCLKLSELLSLVANFYPYFKVRFCSYFFFFVAVVVVVFFFSGSSTLRPCRRNYLCFLRRVCCFLSFLSSLRLNNKIRLARSESPTSRFEQFLLYKLN